MLSKEEKAKIARENGAKSKGPTTQEGKDRSRANGLKTGERATTLRHLAQPHPGILCNEDSHAFFQLFHDLIKAYKPVGQLAIDIVREIAIARTEITRTQHVKAAAWNRQIHQEQAKAAHLRAELIPVETAINTGLVMLKSDAQFDRAIDRLFRRIVALEKRLIGVQAHFPEPEVADANNQTNPDIPQPESNEQHTETEEEPLYTDDPSPATREAYEFFFPGRKLIVVPTKSDLDPN